MGELPGYEIERELAAAGGITIAGVDEVGRGAWAGPVAVCAAVARPGFPEPPEGLTDSKRLTQRRREELAAVLPGWLTAHAIGAASHAEIDALGMTAALRLAARRALGALPLPPGRGAARRQARLHRPAVAGAHGGQGRPAVGVRRRRVRHRQGAQGRA